MKLPFSPALPSFALLISLAAGQVTAGHPDSCFAVSPPVARKSCAGGIDITLRNTCGESLDSRFCLERSDKPLWNCGVRFDVKPNQEFSSFVCPGTGRYKVWGRNTAAKTLPFPEEKGDFRRQANAIYSVAPGESKELACERAREFAGGSCECEARNGSTGFRCRVKVENADAEVEAQAKPFASDAFKPATSAAGVAKTPAKPAEVASGSKVATGVFTASGANETDACAKVRRMANQPDLACTCKPAGNVALCRAEGPMAVPEKTLLDSSKEKARDLIDGGEPGKRPGDTPRQEGGSGRRS